jgi:hypothetical protein
MISATIAAPADEPQLSAFVVPVHERLTPLQGCQRGVRCFARWGVRTIPV